MLSHFKYLNYIQSDESKIYTIKTSVDSVILYIQNQPGNPADSYN